MTTFGTQSITTLNNLNMEGEFASSSITQFEHVNTATITYSDDLGEATDTASSGKTITLYDAIAGSNVTFTYKNPGTGATPGTGVTDFERVTGNADSTATNLQIAINNQTNFTAGINTTTNTITITQTTSKSFNPNGSIHSDWGSPSRITSISDFSITTQAAIPSDTIGTYQIINKVSSDLASIKKKILDTQKNLITDLSDNTDNTTIVINNNPFTSDASLGAATHQSNIGNDRGRGGLTETTNTTNQKPAIFKSYDIKYSEDALFTFLKGISYEILKFRNGINGANNDGTQAYAGLAAIPVSVLITNNTTTTATIGNVKATIENVNKIGNILTSNTTSDGSMPFASTGLISIINQSIEDISFIKRTIKTNERAIIEALKVSNDTPSLTPSTYDAIITTLKKRGGFVDDDGVAATTHKPTIYDVGGKQFSEDAVFAFFSSLSYELMKLLNNHNGANNGASAGYAGLVAIPISVEAI